MVGRGLHFLLRLFLPSLHDDFHPIVQSHLGALQTELPCHPFLADTFSQIDLFGHPTFGAIDVQGHLELHFFVEVLAGLRVEGDGGEQTQLVGELDWRLRGCELHGVCLIHLDRSFAVLVGGSPKDGDLHFEALLKFEFDCRWLEKNLDRPVHCCNHSIYYRLLLLKYRPDHPCTFITIPALQS